MLIHGNVPPRQPPGRPPGPRNYYNLKEAAPRLGLSVGALRARCTRGAVREGREVRCHLGDGVVAIKFGRTWRVKFPD
jgi:hypothetical protein